MPRPSTRMFALVFAFALAIAGGVALQTTSNVATTTAPAAATTVETTHSDADIFDGIFFGIGPIADELGYHNPTIDDETLEAANFLRDDIKQRHAKQYASIIDGLTSGDVASVHGSIELGADLLTESAQEHFGEESNDPEQINPNAAIVLGPAVAVVAYAAAVAHNTVAVTALVWAGAAVTDAGISPFADDAELSELDVDVQNELLRIADSLEGK